MVRRKLGVMVSERAKKVVLERALDREVNYLHFGSALSGMAYIVPLLESNREVLKGDVLNLARSRISKRRNLEEVCDIIKRYGGEEEKKILVRKLLHDYRKSLEWRGRFRQLGCRGFSFGIAMNPKLYAAPGFRATHSMALTMSSSLYYPPSLRRAVSGVAYRALREKAHIKDAIAWIGSVDEVSSGAKVRIVVNIQSDLSRMSSNVINSVFSGWQRVIFFQYCVFSALDGVDVIAVPTAESISHTIYSYRTWGVVPYRWKTLYDSTAIFFGMQASPELGGVNIQSSVYRTPVYCNEMFVGNVAEILRRWS